MSTLQFYTIITIQIPKPPSLPAVSGAESPKTSGTGCFQYHAYTVAAQTDCSTTRFLLKRLPESCALRFAQILEEYHWIGDGIIHLCHPYHYAIGRLRLQDDFQRPLNAAQMQGEVQ